MSKHEFVAVALRILAIILGLRALNDIQMLIAWLFATDAFGWTMAASILITVLYALIPLLLWVFALPIAGFCLPKSAADSPRTPLPASLESIGFLILGTYVLVLSVPELVYGWMLFAQSRRILGGTWEPGPEEIARVVAGFVKLILAIWVLLGARGLRRLVSSFRGNLDTGGRDGASNQR